jgi:hypothetical protein
LKEENMGALFFGLLIIGLTAAGGWALEKLFPGLGEKAERKFMEVNRGRNH